MMHSFPITTRWVRSHTPGQQAARDQVRAATEATCRACQWFSAPQEKCAHPRTRDFTLCWSSRRRSRPWTHGAPAGPACPLSAPNAGPA